MVVQGGRDSAIDGSRDAMLELLRLLSFADPEREELPPSARAFAFGTKSINQAMGLAGTRTGDLVGWVKIDRAANHAVSRGTRVCALHRHHFTSATV